MKNIVISGSTAYDFIMDYKGKFKNDIKSDKLENLSIGFLISKLKKEMGGTGLNIAYNLAILGDKPILLSAVGNDFSFDGFFKEKINLDYIYQSTKLLSASGYITTDSDANQITAFYPGAMDRATNTSIKEIREEIDYVIVSPNQKEAMIKHLKESKELGLNVFFDPGQQLLTFNKSELEELSTYANYLIVNSYEYDEFKNIITKDEKQLIQIFDKIIITLGKDGSRILSKDGEKLIPVVKAKEIIDPTGAGDAYRAGLLRGLKLGYSWEKSAKLGSLISSHCIQFHGGQSHFVSKCALEEEYKEKFGEKIDLYTEKKTICNSQKII